VFYLGAIDALHLDATMDWELDRDNQRHWIWTWPGDERIEFLLNSAGTAGWLRDERWSFGEAAWRLAHTLSWQDGHGAWVAYGSGGLPIREVTW
jgi:hypothetical protein